MQLDSSAARYGHWDTAIFRHSRCQLNH